MEAASFAHFAAAVDFGSALALYEAHATSEPGRRLIRGLAPVADLEEVRARLAETVEMRRLVGPDARRLPLRGITDVYTLAEDACERGRPLEPGGLDQVADACEAGRALRALLTDLEPEAFPALRGRGATLPVLSEIEVAIRGAIEGQRIRDSASERLQRLRGEIAHLKAELDRKIDHIAASDAMRGALQSPKPTLRGGRYVLAVRAGYRPRPKGILHDRSQTGGTIYIEPHETVGLGNELSDLLFRERDEETRILWDLSREVFAMRPDLRALVEALAEVDAIVAKAGAMAAYALEAPRVTDEGPLVLKDARHPLLLEQLRTGRLPGAEVVPMSLRLGDGFDLIVITGPNTGGKTVALKTTGLLAALALSGCPIPAAVGTEVPLLTGFYADIGDEQGIEASLSTFSGHLKELVRILAEADGRSLVLIDELGVGTDPEEGSALGAAILEALLEKRARGVVTTHLGALKAFAYSRPRVENACVAFDLDTLAPTFQLTVGVPGASHALEIARRLGMPGPIVDRASEIQGQRGVGETELLDTVQRLRGLAEADRAEAESLRADAQRERDEAATEHEQARVEREALTRESDSVVGDLFRKVRDAVLESERRAEGLPQRSREVLQELSSSLLPILEHTPFAERRRAFARSLAKGARVYVIRFGREGVVTRIHKGRERVTVKLGDAQIETSFDDLSWIETEEGGRTTRKTRSDQHLPEGATLHPDGRKRWTE